MSEILTDASPTALIEAIENNLFASLPLLIRQIPQATLEDGPECLRFLTGVPHPILNGVMQARFDEKDVEDKIDATLAPFFARNLPLMWWTGPQTSPKDIGQRLRKRRLIHVDDMPGMAIDLTTLPSDPPPIPGLRVQEVISEETLRFWLRPLQQGFLLPDIVVEAFGQAVARLGLGPQQPMRHFLALHYGNPVACASLFPGAGVAGIYNVATIPEARRKGLASALVVVALQEARAAGYRYGILQSSEIGESAYRRLGFQEVCKIGVYVWTG